MPGIVQQRSREKRKEEGSSNPAAVTAIECVWNCRSPENFAIIMSVLSLFLSQIIVYKFELLCFVLYKSIDKF